MPSLNPLWWKGFSLNFNERIFAIRVASFKKVASCHWKSFSKTESEIELAIRESKL